MPAENTAIDPFKVKARKFRILAEGSQGSRLDYLVQDQIIQPGAL